MPARPHEEGRRRMEWSGGRRALKRRSARLRYMSPRIASVANNGQRNGRLDGMFGVWVLVHRVEADPLRGLKSPRARCKAASPLR